MKMIIQRMFSREESSGNAKAALSIGAVGLGAGVSANFDSLKKTINKYQPKQNYNNLNIKNGDIVSAERKNGLYNHYGVAEVSPDGKITIHQYGNRTALDPRNSYVHTTTLKDFGQGNKIRVERPNGKFTPEQIIKRAKAQSGQKQFYSISKHNCEHWAREIANGTPKSTQVNSVLRKIKIKRFSIAGTAYDALYEIRKALPTKKMGKLSNFQANQSAYLSGISSVGSGIIGDIRGRKKGRKEAEKLKLEHNSKEYKSYVIQRRNAERRKGLLVGAGIGYGTSKGVDFIRGNEVAKKINQSYGINLKSHGNMTKLGKAMRGVRSEKDVAGWINSGKDYIKGVVEHL